MTIYISPNPGKTSANEIALRAAQILLTHGAAVLMQRIVCGMQYRGCGLSAAGGMP